jgi:predicted nuclease of restriction endonuclease-like (RecB) superfamily
MVQAYWEIGEQICIACGENDRAEYGKNLQQYLSSKLTDEFGRGFSFVARQKHITFDGRHFYIDLVFYNYILKCFVLIDLKIGDLSHQDLS